MSRVNIHLLPVSVYLRGVDWLERGGLLTHLKYVSAIFRMQFDFFYSSRTFLQRMCGFLDKKH